MMYIEDLMLKQKMRADTINLVIAFIGLLILALFLKITILISIIIYPICSLLFYGMIRIKKGFTKKVKETPLKILNILFGFGCILFGFLFLIFIFSYPNIGLKVIINLFAFPVILIGIAGIVKGIIISGYLNKYRALNIFIGIITVIIAIIAFISTENGFIFNISTLMIAILLNLISRASMYLSEYQLSLKLRNLRFFIYILNDYSESEILREIMLRKMSKN